MLCDGLIKWTIRDLGPPFLSVNRKFNNSLDPVITHSVLDRQFTSVSFATKSPTVVTGDDFGAVMLYKLCKGNGHDEEDAVSGLVSPYATISPATPEAAQWRSAQAQALTNLIASKNNVA